MLVEPSLQFRFKDLARRVQTLPDEIDYWLAQAAEDDLLEKNFSQLEALDIFMQHLIQRNDKALDMLGACDESDIFLHQAHRVSSYVYKTHHIWDFFRGKLEMRMVSAFQRMLLACDLISHDCYYAALDRARALRLIPQNGFREYPLTYLASESSSATWVRGSKPQTHGVLHLSNDRLPIAVIEVPWDYVSTPWNLLFIHHEVAHDIDADLNRLSLAVAVNLETRLHERGVPVQRIRCWVVWSGEILADLLAILLGGPAYSSALMNQLLLPQPMISRIDCRVPHPAPSVRLYLNTVFVRTLEQGADVFNEYAHMLEKRWERIYGAPAEEVGLFLSDLTDVIEAVADMPLNVIRDLDGMPHCLRDFGSYTSREHRQVQVMKQNLLSSSASTPTKDHTPLRHIVGSSYLAFEQIVENGGDDVDEKLSLLAERSLGSILQSAPPGQLPAGITSERVRAHLIRLADEYLDSELDEAQTSSHQGPGNDY